MKRYVLVVEWDTCSNIHVIHHRENFLITAENVFDAINDARKVYERGDPHPCMYVGYMPMIKIGGVSRPIIRFVTTTEIKFYGHDWHEITEEEYRKQFTVIPKENFNFVKSNVTYNEDSDTYTVNKRLMVSRLGDK